MTFWYAPNLPEPPPGGGGGGGAVSSVQGRTGAVTLDDLYGRLSPTAVKTGNYTAAEGDFVPVDTTSAAPTVTLPSAPANKAQIGVRLVTKPGSNNVTVARGGTDVFNKSGGATSITLSTVGHEVVLQYQATGGIWHVLSDNTIASGGGGGNVATDTIWDAKGDLAVGTGADTASKLSVGADGTVVQADSTQPTGLKFAALTSLAAGADIDLPAVVGGVQTIGVLATSSQKWGHSDYDALSADDSGRLNTTTQTPVSGLSLALAANAIYFFESVIHYTATTVADIKASFQNTATGTTWWMRTTGFDTATLAWIVNTRAETDLLYRYGGNGATVQSFDARGIIRTGGTAGTLDFNYAQNTLENITPTIVKAGSYMRLQRLL